MAKPKKPPGTTGLSGHELPPPPPEWDRPVGAPEPIDPAQDTVRTQPIFRLDEATFMDEVASRLNAFLVTYPAEAQHVLSQFIEYEHELVDIHAEIRRRRRTHQGRPPEESPPTPGITVAQLFAAILQTHHGTGWVLRPVLLPDPDAGVGYVRIVKFVVDRQEEDEGSKS